MMTRDEMMAEAKRIGLRGAHLMKDETLRAKLDAPPVEVVLVRCVVANVWTSNGKLWRGDEAIVDAAERALLADKVEEVE